MSSGACGLEVSLLLEELEQKLSEEGTTSSTTKQQSELAAPRHDPATHGCATAPDSSTDACISKLCRVLDVEASKRREAPQHTETISPVDKLCGKVVSTVPGPPVPSTAATEIGCPDLDDLIVQGFAILADGSSDGPQLLKLDRSRLETKGPAKELHDDPAWDFWKPNADDEDEKQTESVDCSCESSIVC